MNIFSDKDQNPKRITIFDIPGSGKTTLSKRLGQNLQLPVYHLDKLLWEKGWKLRRREDFLKDQRAILDTSAWIIEGSTLSTLEERYKQSNVVIYLHPTRFSCLLRVFRRRFMQKELPSDKAEGNKERITWDFIQYLWRFEHSATLKIITLKEQYPHVTLIDIQTAGGSISLDQLNELYDTESEPL